MKTLRFILVLLLLCSLPLCALAMDEGYLGDQSAWQFNNKVVHMPEQDLGTYRGMGSYYSDLANNCFYLHLSYEENSLKNAENEIYLQFNIENSSREYQFSIDANGFVNYDAYVSKAFSVKQNFKDASELGQEIYVGIEFLNKNDKLLNNYLSFTISINGRTYELCSKRIKLAYGDYAYSQTTAKQTETKPSTTKETTTKTATTTKPATTKEAATKQSTTKKETTTKFKYTYIPTTGATEKATDNTKEKTTKQKAESTTKFKYTGGTSPTPSEGYDKNVSAGDGADVFEENTTASEYQPGNDQTENSVIIQETDNGSGSPPQAKLMTALAVIFAAGGIAFIARGITLKKKNTNESGEEE